MARAPGDDLRSRVLKAWAERASTRPAVSRFGVGVSRVIGWIARTKAGKVSLRPQGRRQASGFDAHTGSVFAMSETCKDIMLNGMVDGLLAGQSGRIGRSALSTRLRRHGWTYKNSPRRRWSRTAPTL